MSRLFCDTIALRLLILVAVCLGLSVGLTWFVIHVGAVTPDFRFHQMAERIGGTAAAIEAAPPEARRAMAAHASAPGYTLGWAAEGPAGSDVAPTPALRSALARELTESHARIRPLADPADTFAMILADGSALLVTPSTRPGWVLQDVPNPLLPLTLLGVSALLVCLLAARGVATGIARFAETAEQFGRAARVLPVPVRGPREIRSAIVAFNAMQARIEQMMQERTVMLGALSHDLRTPLARLRLRAEFVGEPAAQQRMLRDLDEMGALIDQSLLFLRDEARDEPATRLDLAVLLQGIAEEQADMGRSVDFRGPAHATIAARPVSLKRALANIVENAVKFGTRAEIDLRVEDGAAAVAVIDDGPGIPEALRELVFQPFFRAEKSRNRETGGVGLGLSIARSVVRAHGGEISLSDHALGGLIVRIDLPAGLTV